MKLSNEAEEVADDVVAIVVGYVGIMFDNVVNVELSKLQGRFEVVQSIIVDVSIITLIVIIVVLSLPS